jgi:hypothetical protein
VVARASDFAVLLSLVGAGAGVTLVPGLAARWLPPGVRLVPPAEPVTRRVFTVSRRGGDRKPAVRVVLDALSAAALPAETLSAAALPAEAGSAAALSAEALPAEAGSAAAIPEPGSRRAG